MTLAEQLDEELAVYWPTEPEKKSDRIEIDGDVASSINDVADWCWSMLGSPNDDKIRDLYNAICELKPLLVCDVCEL